MTATCYDLPASSQWRVLIRGLVAYSVGVVLCLLTSTACAHRFAPSALTITQLNDSEYSVTWKTPLQSITTTPLRVELPALCEALQTSPWVPEGTGKVRQLSVSCNGQLTGSTIRIHGLPEHQTSVVLALNLVNGIQHQAVLTPRSQTFVVPREPNPWQVIGRYTVLGGEHIWAGIDHLLFVMGLLMLVGGGTRLYITITAFTLGHSVTLAMVTLGLFRYPVALIELLIAASVLLLAVELTRPGGSSRLWRSPWWLAGVFGLLHGMGFAGALAETGLPQRHAPLALLFFNIGIELGQLSFIAVSLVLKAVVKRTMPLRPVAFDQMPVLVLGTLSAMWCIERGLEVLSIL